MAYREIFEVPEDVLYKKSKPVTEFSEKTVSIIKDLEDTLSEAGGVGLAAPQVGILRRIFILDIPEQKDDDGEVIVEPLKKEFINPEIIKEEDFVMHEGEGCLSVPGKRGDVKRANKIVLTALDRTGKRFKIEADDFHAFALQHELDHLNGVVYIDKAENIRDA